jgi:hypothetical protein
MSYEGNARYQYQPWHVKAFRQARWLPFLWLRIAFICAWFRVCGNRIYFDRSHFKTRRDYFDHLWMVERSMHAMRIGHVWTHSEMIAELREKSRRQA